MSELKVYGGMKLRGPRQVRCIVAARSQKEAAPAAHESMHGFRTYWGKTGNAKEIEIATAAPGVLFYCDAPRGSYAGEGYEWKRYFEE